DGSTILDEYRRTGFKEPPVCLRRAGWTPNPRPAALFGERLLTLFLSKIDSPKNKELSRV
ncbi:hypothetical protein RJ60_14950, partial [Mesotoga sp. B105.6.4]